MTDTDNHDDDDMHADEVGVSLRRYAKAIVATADESEATGTKVEMSPPDARELADLLFRALLLLT